MGYPGGKGRIYSRIIGMMPPHDVYIETHLGGGAVLRNKRPAQTSFGIDIDPAVIDRWPAASIDGFTGVEGDAVAFLDAYRFTGRELVYCDPPYHPATRRRSRIYRFDYKVNDHERLLQTIVQLPCMVMISGYANDLYSRVLTAWRRVDFPAPTQAGLRTESVWLNFDPPAELHDYSHLGSDFRERELIRRRRRRMAERLGNMAAMERRALIVELAAREGMVLAPPAPPARRLLDA